MKRILMLLLLCLGLSSCSTDDSEIVSETSTIPNIEFVGVDNDNTYLYDYRAEVGIGEQTNLSSELGLGTNFLTLRQTEQELSFYTFNSGKFSLLKKDIESRETDTYIDFYTNTNERSIVWGINTKDQVYFGFYNPKGSTNLALRAISLTTLNGNDISLEFNINTLYQPILIDENLFITYLDGQERYKITRYNTDTNTLTQTLDFGTSSPSLFDDDLGNLVILKFAENGKVDMEIRDSNSLSLIKEQNLALEQRFLPGPLNASLIGNKLYYQYTYQQPFIIDKGPAIFNINTSENKVLDFIGIIDEVEQELDVSVNIITEYYDPGKNVFLASYQKFDELYGGVLIINEDGKLLKNIELDFVPIYFVK
ncbi:hypothetical protein ACOCEA_03965 [Maribacter sp. CXY002]|uniref:hypothetical protein n=1 Tax=Maribacter luteocoastalis TaxID=3407671 RepID=UPI003B680231